MRISSIFAVFCMCFLFTFGFGQKGEAEKVNPEKKVYKFKTMTIIPDEESPDFILIDVPGEMKIKIARLQKSFKDDLEENLDREKLETETGVIGRASAEVGQ